MRLFLALKSLSSHGSLNQGLGYAAKMIYLRTCKVKNEKSWMDEYNSLYGDTQKAVLLPVEEIILSLVNMINYYI